MELNDDGPATEEELLLQLAAAAKDEAEAQAKYDVDKDAKELLVAEKKRVEEEMRERLNKLAADIYKIDEGRWDVQRALREKTKQRESLERRLMQAKAAKERALEWSTLEKRWDLLTAGAPWREWAKDHQLEGAKKMVYEGDMILADVMGLGKTLTVLIACDMIEQATKDASYENPVSFGSLQ